MFKELTPDLQIYTDGSALSSSGPSGSGFAMMHSDGKPITYFSHPLGDHSVLFSEVDAIVQAAEFLNQHPQKYSQVYFFVDNNTALQLATGWCIPKPNSSHADLVCRLHNILRVLNQDYTVSFVWSPSHCNISGNEIADKLAKRGANGITSQEPPD